MEELYKELLAVASDNGYKANDMELIEKAYQFALKEHKGMRRKNGEDYISHPLNVALIVANLNADATTVISALVHETIDHGHSSFEELEELFGSEVRKIVTSLTKVNRLHLLDDSESSSLYLRKVLVALSEDVRVIILKLAGRLHNMRTYEGLPENKQKQKARETWNVLIPIAHRLGINSIASELENISFRILKPDIYEEIENSLPAPRSELQANIDEMIEEISEALQSNNIKFEISGRVKSVSSLHNKLSTWRGWNDIYDIMGIRVITEEESECYLVIGLIHSLYRPIPKRFKDYIAMPKGNSYQSLHTGVFGKNGLAVEVQVRTKEMHEIAEHGVASHWSYKEKGSKHIQNLMEQKLQMFRNIIDANADDIIDDNQFIDNVSNELLTKSIYVYTPKGDVVELPDGSSPIDFAYRIHSHIGDTTVGAIVNDQMVTLDYKLKDNDIVKIMTNNTSSPNKDWLTFVKTTAAKTKIKAYFSKQDREEYITRGKELLEKELRRQKISFDDAFKEERQEKLLSDLKVGSIEEVYLLIGSMRYTPIYIVNLLFEEKQNVQDLLLDKVTSNVSFTKENYKNDVIVDGCDDILVNLASCCKPVYGDEILGYITRGQGVTVHKKDCKNIADLKERIISVSWNQKRGENPREYIAKLVIITNNINHNLTDIVTKASLKNVSINSINEVMRNGNTTYDVLVKVKNKDNLENFIEEIRTLSFVTDVKRV